MEVLVIGGGGREHAIADKLSESSEVDRIFVAPGNAGTFEFADNLPYLQPTDIPGLLQFAESRRPDLTIVGPDEPLALGVVDEFQARGLPIFGPTAAAAQIESSKTFAKMVMQTAGVETASSKTVFNMQEAKDYLKGHELPVVIKSDKLEGGKGVTICEKMQEAKLALRGVLESRKPVVIEEYMEGYEVSLHAITDGKNYKMFPVSRDHKTRFVDNTGPMTGGMGVVSPIPGIDQDQLGEVVVAPVLEAMDYLGIPFRGVLYPGVMITQQGPKVIEYNARFGDPEAEAYMRLLGSDLLGLIQAVNEGTLAETPIDWSDGHVTTLALVSEKYPKQAQRFQVIEGIAQADQREGVKVYHGATAIIAGNTIVTGGRALHVTAVGESAGESKQRAYDAAELIDFEGKQLRPDIGTHMLHL